MNLKVAAIAGIGVAVAGIAVKVFVDKSSDKIVKEVEDRHKNGEYVSEEDIEKISEEAVIETAEKAAMVVSTGVKVVTAMGVGRLANQYVVKYCPSTSIPSFLIMMITSQVLGGMLAHKAFSYIDRTTNNMIDSSKYAMEKFKDRKIEKEEQDGESGNGKVVSGPWRH